MQHHSTQSQASFTNEVQRKTKRVLFGRVWSNQVTRFYVFGIVLLQKEKTPEQDAVKLLGVPLFQTRHIGYEKKHYLFGIPLVTRPNIRFLEEQVSKQIDRLLSLPASCAPKDPLADDAALRAGMERLFDMPTYRVMCDARDHIITLESELQIVTAQVEQSLAQEGKINA